MSTTFGPTADFFSEYMGTLYLRIKWNQLIQWLTTWVNRPDRHLWDYYRKTSNISRTLVINKIVDNSDVVGASPVGAAPTTSSFST